MGTIPASQFVSVTPGVLSAGGNALAFNALILTNSRRVPIGEILAFPSAAAVSAFFGASSDEASAAATYFKGFDNSNIKPTSLLITQYNTLAAFAWLQGGNVSSLTLDQLHALSGTLTLSIDGLSVTSSAIDLSGAVSFSAAAALIEAGLAHYDGVTSSATTIAAGTATNTTAGSIAGDVLTVGGTITGAFVVGGVLSGTGVTSGTEILAQLTGTPGGAGTYQVSKVQNVSTATITQTYGLMTVAGIASGYLAPGQTISGGTIAAGTKIVSQASGATVGGTGTYITSGGSQTVSATAVSAGKLTCAYDSVSGAFVLTGGTPGALGSIDFATGTLSAGLNLTSVTGASKSQGAAPADPLSFMAAVVNKTQNWVTFMTLFAPDAYGNTNKLLFANWVNATIDRYTYVVWDTDTSLFSSSNASGNLANILKAGNYSGTLHISAPDYTLAAYACGQAASVDYQERNGMTNPCFRAQSGITPYVTDQTAYNNMIANGSNSYVAVATANQGFNFFATGQMAGPFKWFDEYLNQIWLNNAFQLAMLTLLTSAKSVPNNAAGRTLIRAAALDPINAGLNFGMFGPSDPMSAAQAAEINFSAGADIANTITAQGWYLQILPATAQVRAARQSPPMTFWYAYQQSINKLDLASIEVQ